MYNLKINFSIISLRIYTVVVSYLVYRIYPEFLNEISRHMSKQNRSVRHL